jgi:hypothetical protein
MITRVFKTNIDTEQKFNYVNYLFRKIPQIQHWSVDKEDSDKILRVVLTAELVDSNVREWLDRINIRCEELT